MMIKKVLIIEDEMIAAQRLSRLVGEVRKDYEIINAIQTVEESVHWFRNNEVPDLVFLDIHLSDGLSFTIFSKVQINVPIIFTTAYDKYALKAFEVNSIDYILKPIDRDKLEKAIDKFERLKSPVGSIPVHKIEELIKAVTSSKYKTRFLVKSGNAFTFLEQEEISLFYSEDGMVFLRSIENKRHVIDSTLEHLENLLDPSTFFRINRSIIIHLRAINKIHSYRNGRFKLQAETDPAIPLIVARERARDFKKWIDGGR